MGSQLNLITDLEGLAVGHADDPVAATGVTTVLIDQPNTIAGVIRGGAAGTRDATILSLDAHVQGADAVVLSGGSAFGLDAAGGVMAVLRERGIGVRIREAVVPIVVQAIVFDLLNGGDKSWGRKSPYFNLGASAAERATRSVFDLGSVGGGYGATTSTFKGGLGSASIVTSSGFKVGAIVVVNAVGTATIGQGPHFWAAGVELGGEFGGLGFPNHLTDADRALLIKGGDPTPPSTTIALVATDAALSKPQTSRVAQMADDGLARAIRPAHAPMDGDTVMAVALQRRALRPHMEALELTEIGLAAADCLSRAIARGVFEARALPFPGALPAWRDRFEHLIPKPLRPV